MIRPSNNQLVAYHGQSLRLVENSPLNMENAVKMIRGQPRCSFLEIKGKILKIKFWKSEFLNNDCRFGLLVKEYDCKVCPFSHFPIRTQSNSASKRQNELKLTITLTKFDYILNIQNIKGNSYCYHIFSARNLNLQSKFEYSAFQNLTAYNFWT